MHLLCNQLFQNFNGQILLRHLGDFLQIGCIEEIKFLVGICKQIDNAIALDRLT